MSANDPLRLEANRVFGEYVIPGVSASGRKRVQKKEVRDLMGLAVDRLVSIEALAGAGVRWTANRVRVRATANVDIASALENGDTLNGEVLATNDVAFLPCQSAGATVTDPVTGFTNSPANGLYLIGASGPAVRVGWANSAAELARLGFMIDEGTEGAGELWTLPLDAEGITLETTGLAFARLGKPVDVAGEVADARGGEPSLGDRLSAIVGSRAFGKADWSVEYGPIWETAQIVGGDLSFISEQPRTNDFSAFGDLLEVPTVTTRGWFIGRLALATAGAAGGVTEPRVPVLLRMTARVGNAEAEIVAADTPAALVGEIALDPDQTAWTNLFIPFRDADGGLVTMEPEDWTGDLVGNVMQVWDANGNPASINQPLGDHDHRASPAGSFFLTSGDAREDVWLGLSGDFGIAIQWADFVDLRDDYSPTSALRAALMTASAMTAPLGAANGDRLRQLKQKLFLLSAGADVQLDVPFFGDSWTDATFRYVEEIAIWLTETYGDGGPGWIGFGFPAHDTNAIHGNARGNHYTAAKSGTWTSDFCNGAAIGPDVSNAKSSEAGAKYTIIAYAPCTAVLDELRLFWEGTANGVVRYRMGDYSGAGSRGNIASYSLGAWTSLNVQGSGHQSAELAGLPTTPHWGCEIEVVSGSVRLNGLNGKAAGPGVRVHKLGCTGSMVTGWTASDADEFQAALTTLGGDTAIGIWGTNEKAANQPLPTWDAALREFWGRVREALPAADLGIGMPCENVTEKNHTMAEYAQVAFGVAEAIDAAWLNLQSAFGKNAADYAHGSANPLMRDDNAHPLAASYRDYDPTAKLIGNIPAAVKRWFLN